MIPTAINGTGETLPTDPRRVRAFARFFKNYMSVSSVILAALPIPIAKLNLLPTFADQTNVLLTYTSLFCFLALGFIFSIRHGLARWIFPAPEAASMFPADDRDALEEEKRRAAAIGRRNSRRAVLVGLTPLLLIILAALFMLAYQTALDDTVALLSDPQLKATRKDILAATYNNVPNGSWLMFFYIGMFVFAEAAFIFMAIREYIQDLLHLTDVDVIYHRFAEASDQRPSARGIR